MSVQGRSQDGMGARDGARPPVPLDRAAWDALPGLLAHLDRPVRSVLVVNDDGIDAPGLRELAILAARAFRGAAVDVVAPRAHQSGASHRISLEWPKRVEERVGFPAPGVRTAYAVDGTPADCTSLALGCLCPTPPDLVLSGVNQGLNVGFDIMYSGTVAAAMEGAMRGVPSVAFSLTRTAPDYALLRAVFPQVMADILFRHPCVDGIWNVNLPHESPSVAGGILYDRAPARGDFRPVAGYALVDEADEELAGPAGAVVRTLSLAPVAAADGAACSAGDASTDLGAICAGCVSVGWVPCMV